MKKWIIFSVVFVAIVVVLLVVLLGLDELRAPELRNVSLEWGEVASATTEVLGTLTIYNPNSVSLPIEGITCDIKMDGIKVGSAETIDLQIVKEAEFPVNVVAKIDNVKMPGFWAEHVRRDEKSIAEIEIHIAFNLQGVRFTIPYTLKQSIETDILSYLNEAEPVSFEEKVDVPILGEKTAFKISLNRLSGAWGTATSQASEIELVANVYNDNPYPLLIPKIECFVESNGMNIGLGETGLVNAMLPKSEKDIEIAANIDTSLMDEWFVRHIQQGEKSTFGIRILMTFGLPEEILEMIGLEDLTITLWEDTYEFETDILGNKHN